MLTSSIPHSVGAGRQALAEWRVAAASMRASRAGPAEPCAALSEGGRDARYIGVLLERAHGAIVPGLGRLYIAPQRGLMGAKRRLGRRRRRIRSRRTGAVRCGVSSPRAARSRLLAAQSEGNGTDEGTSGAIAMAVEVEQHSHCTPRPLTASPGPRFFCSSSAC